jgi:hypothetical protein
MGSTRAGSPSGQLRVPMRPESDGRGETPAATGAEDRAAPQGLPGALQSVSIISRIEKRRTNSVEQLGQR